MPNHGDPLRGKRFHLGFERSDIGFGQQFVCQHLCVTNVKIFLSPVPDFSAGDLPIRGTEAHRRSAGTPFENMASSEKILVIAVKSDRKSTRLNSSHEWISYAV